MSCLHLKHIVGLVSPQVLGSSVALSELTQRFTVLLWVLRHSYELYDSKQQPCVSIGGEGLDVKFELGRFLLGPCEGCLFRAFLWFLGVAASSHCFSVSPVSSHGFLSVSASLVL